MPEKSIEEILKDIINKSQTDLFNDEGELCKECIDELIEESTQSIKAYYLAKLPKEIYGSGFDKKRFNQGYNQAIAEMCKTIEESF